MSDPADQPASAHEQLAPVERELLVRLGAAMTVAGESIDEVGTRIESLARARGIRDLSVLVLPTALVVQTGTGGATQLRMEAFVNRSLRLDQIAAVYALVARVERSEVDPAEELAELDLVVASPPPVGAVARTLGLGLLSVGFSLLLQPSIPDMVVAFTLGLLIGLVRLLRLATLQAVLPVLAAFGVAAIVFSTADIHATGNPIRTLIPPLITFLPGAMLTTGMRDLAAGQVISGASRLVQGVVVLALLAFGIAAAATLVGVPSGDLLDHPAARLGPWAPWLALVFVAFGTHLHHCAPRNALPWILLVLAAAYGGQTAAAAVFSPELSPFFGALAMTPLVLWIESLDRGTPSMVTFLPGFWLLVPGAAGLIGVTEIVGTDSVLGPADLAATFSTVIEIALGVLIGSAVTRAGTAGVQGAVRTISGQRGR